MNLRGFSGGAAADTGRPALHINVLTRPEEFDALADAWTRLEARCPTASIFVSFDWQRLWWRHYGGDKALKIVVALEAGVAVGILPLHVQRGRFMGFYPVRRLRIVGTGGDTSPDYLDPLVDPDLGDPVAVALADYVATQLDGWDVLQFSDLDPSGTFTKTIHRLCSQRGCLVRVSHAGRNPFGHLPDRWDAYLASLSAHRRQALRQSRRKFEKLEGARFRLCTDRAELDSMFARLADLHRSRWQSRAARHSFSSAEYLAFHGELVHALNARGRLRLYVLELRAQAVAILYCFRFGGSLFYFQGGFEPDLASLSLGQVLIAYAIESAIREGCKVFDMLKGDYGHKRHFFKDTRVSVDIDAFRAGLPTWGYRLKKAMSTLLSVRRPAKQGTQSTTMGQKQDEELVS